MSVMAIVREFHTTFGLAARDVPATVVDMEEVEFRRRLHDEEREELHAAMMAGDLVGVADGLADLVYVLYGTALHYGIDLDAVIAEVHRSNMTKTAPEGGVGKVVKGPEFQAPNIEGELYAQQVLVF
jgi:predicted HAD superfamily Cof-like phosphohydrolase